MAWHLDDHRLADRKLHEVVLGDVPHWALRDSVDMPVRQRGTGEGFDHANEVEEGLASVANARESLYADYKRGLARGNNSTELTELADELASLSNQARAFIKVEP